MQSQDTPTPEPATDPFVSYTRALHDYTLRLWTESRRAVDEKAQGKEAKKGGNETAAEPTQNKTWSPAIGRPLLPTRCDEWSASPCLVYWSVSRLMSPLKVLTLYKRLTQLVFSYFRQTYPIHSETKIWNSPLFMPIIMPSWCLLHNFNSSPTLSMYLSFLSVCNFTRALSRPLYIWLVFFWIIVARTECQSHS